MAGIDSHLRRAQVMFHLLVVCGGLMACIALGWDVRIFNDNCLLYCHMGLKSRVRMATVVDAELTQWGPISVCYYCIFSTVMAIIYAIIWFWFYILLSNWETTSADGKGGEMTSHQLKQHQGSGGYRPPPDVRILFPTMFSSSILFLSQLVNLGFIMVGGQYWCDSLRKSSIQCSDLENILWRADFEDVHLTYIYLQIAQAGSWILLLSIVGVIVIVGCRLHLYFTSSVLKETSFSSKSDLDSLYRRIPQSSPQSENKSFHKATVMESESEDSQTDENSRLQTQSKRYKTG